ncbi:cytochrome P450 [Plantactinospora sp. GCM10030261]|uniref:cytochrome P450 n=1 Tax=Plantactinospora sp. GCM10030261 TaxID=3273420 RepID=UPI0036102448
MQLNPYAGAYLTDPGIIWRRLLDDPVGAHYADDLGLWLISKYEYVRRALGDPSTFANALTLLPVYQPTPEALAVISQIDPPPTTAAADPPTHPRTRKALRATFANTDRRVEEQYGGIVRRRVDQLVDRLAARPGERVDLIAEFAADLPLRVVLDILGVPESDVGRIKQWSDGQIALIWGCPSADEQLRLAQGLLDFWRYCQDLVARRARKGWIGTDFVSRALAYRGGDDAVLTESEVASMAFNLLVAGHETTAGLLAHALDFALTEPDRWRGMAVDPTGIPSFVAETLRYAPAIDGWLRLTLRPVTLGDVTIPAGARCLLLIGAANRDSAVYRDPDRFDPHRSVGREHLSFGYGPHFCIGAALARLETEIALRRLTAAIPGLRLAADYSRSYKANFAFRAHRSLPAIVDIGVPLGTPAQRMMASVPEAA